jgi:hypothetical protein
LPWLSLCLRIGGTHTATGIVITTGTVTEGFITMAIATAMIGSIMIVMTVAMTSAGEIATTAGARIEIGVIAIADAIGTMTATVVN